LGFAAKPSFIESSMVQMDLSDGYFGDYSNASAHTRGHHRNSSVDR